MPVRVDPETFDITVIEDRDWTIKFTITDETGAVVNLTGATANFTVKQNLDSASDLFTAKTVGAGITLTDPVNGILQVAGVPADTDGAAGDYLYELDITLTAINDSVRIGNFIVQRKIGA